MRFSSLIIFIVLVAHNYVFAQFPYSTSSKKAIKLIQQAQKAPTAKRDPLTGALNYTEAIRLIDAAIKKDENFWEAYLLKGEFLEYQRKYAEAAKCYQKALEIEPMHSISGSTHYFLATCQYTIGDYEGSLKNINIFLKNPNSNEKWLQDANKLKDCAIFSMEAIKAPKSFEPHNVGPGVNTPFSEYYPTITVDASVLLFTRRVKFMVDGKQDEQEDFYISTFDNQNKMWADAKPMPNIINTAWNEGAPTISGDGKTIIFVACTDPSGVNYGGNRTGKGSCDLFITHKINGRWSPPINLPGKVNTSNWETQPSLSADGQTLYFIRAIRSREAKTNSDIYVAFLQENGEWSEGQRLPNTINSMANEESVQIHPDGRTLYFASRGHIGLGGSDLFVSKMDDLGNWSKPTNLGYPINTRFDENSLLVSAKGDIAYFASDREGGFGGLDIYWFELPREMQAVQTYYFEGTAFDAINNKKLEAHITLSDLNSGKIIFDGFTDAFDGKITLPLPINNSYAVIVNRDGYHPFSLNFDLRIKENAQSFLLDMPLNPIQSAAENILNNVFFDLAKSTLRPESKIELSNLAQYLKMNAQINIEIQGHTDSQGDSINNLLLSEQRANAVRDFLINEGIEAKRLVSKGYGSNQPLVSDEKIALMVLPKEIAAAHQKNRRTSYKIIQ